MQLRAATSADSAAIASVIVRAFASYGTPLDPPASALRETADSIAARLAHERAIVAEAAGRVVGCVMVKPGTGPAAAAYVGRLAVDPAWHGHGVGRALVAAAEDAARAAGAARVTLGVRIALPQNQRFFAACGFHEVAREAHPGYAHPTFIRMEKVLA